MSSLFYNTKQAVDNFMFQHSLKVSEEFIDCADRQLTELFIKETGLRPGKNISLTILQHHTGAPIYTSYMKDELVGMAYHMGRKLLINLYVNHNWNPVTIYWESLSGRDYKLHDTNIDCTDIRFWFGPLDTILYHKQFYPKDPLPFKLKDLTYELEIFRVNVDCMLAMLVREDAINQVQSLILGINDFIEDFNVKSEKKERNNGVVHNAKSSVPEPDVIIYEIDLGSAGYVFLKKFLRYLSDLNVFSKVIVE